MPIALLLILHAILLWHSVRMKSATVDELSHLSAGLYSMTRLDFRLNRASPPLPNLICALPVLMSHDVTLSDHYGWRMGIWNGLGDRLVEDNPETFHSILMAGRLGTIVLSVLLCLIIFLWSRELWGYVPALLVLCLVVFEPNVLAHGRLTTTDVCASLFFVLTGYLFWRFFKRPSLIRLSWLSISVGLAWLSKHSGAVLYIALFIGFLYFAYTHPTRRMIPRFYLRFPRSIRLALWAMGLTFYVFCVSLIVVWAGYGFEIGDPISGSREPVHSQFLKDLIVPMNSVAMFFGREEPLSFDLNNPNEPLWLWLRKWTPLFTHIEAFLANQAHLRTGHLGFFMGELSSRGWLSYYPILFLIKTPIPLLLVFFLGVGLILMGRVSLAKTTLLGLFLIPLVLLYFLLFKNTANIGYRHALPVIPFIFVGFAGAVFSYLYEQIVWDSWFSDLFLKKNRSAFILLFIFIGGTIGSVLSQHPHYISYFNYAVGGPKYGHYYAVDSNLDWGQDLLFLKQAVEEGMIPAPRLIYFGSEHLPDAYEVSYESVPRDRPLEPGLYVISASSLRGIGMERFFKHLRPFQRRFPDGFITPSLLIYTHHSEVEE